MMTPATTGRRRLLFLCGCCLVPIVFVLLTSALLRSRSDGRGFFSLSVGATRTEPGAQIDNEAEKETATAEAAKPTPQGWASKPAEWKFDVARDQRNYGLSDEQCTSAFPDFFREVDRAVKWRKDKGLPNIEEHQMDISWRAYGEIMRLMIYERQLYMIDYKWADHGFDIPRAIALLHSIYRSVVAYPGWLPNVEFTITLGDWPDDPEHKWPVWVLTRFHDEEDKWVVPDFGYWSWPLDVLGEYGQVREDIRATEPAWEEKMHKAVWRGSTKTNKLREDLIHAARGWDWSDVQEVIWSDMTTVNSDSKSTLLSMADHCKYQFVVHTEGHSYSGRGKYLLNCESVSIVHPPEWIEPHTHLMVNSGPNQNIIQVERDFSDLHRKMAHYLHKQDQSQQIAKNSAAVFRDRYLTPAAQACYWRRLYKQWRTVSFEPRLYDVVTDETGAVISRKRRGTPFETFVTANFVPTDRAKDAAKDKAG